MRRGFLVASHQLPLGRWIVRGSGVPVGLCVALGTGRAAPHHTAIPTQVIPSPLAVAHQGAEHAEPHPRHISVVLADVLPTLRRPS